MSVAALILDKNGLASKVDKNSAYCARPSPWLTPIWSRDHDKYLESAIGTVPGILLNASPHPREPSSQHAVGQSALPRAKSSSAGAGRCVGVEQTVKDRSL